MDRDWLVYGNTLYEFPILARYTGWRGHGAGMHRHSLDFYAWDRALPDDWVLRVGEHRFYISEGRTGFLGGVNEPGRLAGLALTRDSGGDITVSWLPHFYHVDDTVVAATAYDYVVQAAFGSARNKFTVPIELAAHTTQWFDPPCSGSGGVCTYSG